MVDARKSTTALVLEAVQDVHNQEQIVTRETLAELTRLKRNVIDDRLGTLTDDGMPLRVQRGVYIPAVQYSVARPIFVSLEDEASVV